MIQGHIKPALNSRPAWEIHNKLTAAVLSLSASQNLKGRFSNVLRHQKCDDNNMA